MNYTGNDKNIKKRNEGIIITAIFVTSILPAKPFHASSIFPVFKLINNCNCGLKKRKNKIKKCT